MKTVNITLEVSEMIFDIQNKTYLTGRSREAEGTKSYEAASHMQASDDDENSYQIRRSITNWFNELCTALADYSAECPATVDNLVLEPVDSDGQLTLALAMPDNYNTAATANLGTGIHAYIVNRAIADWFNITNKADAADYTKLAVESLDSVKRSLYKRVRPSRPVFRTIPSI